MIMWQELQPGDPGRLGPYRLRGVLGFGGMGQVFMGESADGQLVAVKVIRADLASDPEFRARFRREVTVARRVSSRFTAPLIGADTDGPVPWLATAYVSGPSLADGARHDGARQSARRDPARGHHAAGQRERAGGFEPQPVRERVTNEPTVDRVPEPERVAESGPGGSGY
jgi:eukaryotic-like serine/threonine-protein kinase